MQGSRFDESSMIYTDFYGAFVWRTRGLECRAANVVNHKPDAIIDRDYENPENNPIQATPDEITQFIERSVADIPDISVREQTIGRMRAGLTLDAAKDDTAETAKVWSDCEEATKSKRDDEFQSGRAQLLREFVCSVPDGREAITNGIILNWFQNWYQDEEIPRYFYGLLARGLLASDGRDCAAMKYLGTPTKERLRAAMVPASIVPLPPPSLAR